MPTIDEIQSQVHELQGEGPRLREVGPGPVVEYVGKAADTAAGVLPDEKPELLVRGLDAVAFQAGFAKTVLDTEVAFAKSLIDAVTKPFTPAKNAPAVKAA